MIDIAAPKVAVPATLLLITLSLEQTRPYAPLLVPLMSWIIIKFILSLSITTADIVVPGVLTAILSAIPLPVGASIAVIIKGLIFLFMFSYLRITFPAYY